MNLLVKEFPALLPHDKITVAGNHLERSATGRQAGRNTDHVGVDVGFVSCRNFDRILGFHIGTVDSREENEAPVVIE